MNPPPFPDPRAILDWICAAVPAPGEIVGLSLFCNPEASEKALCLMDVDKTAVAAVTQRLGGRPFGFTSVTVSLPLTADFKCHARDSGRLTRQRCSCHLDWRCPDDAPLPPAPAPGRG